MVFVVGTKLALSMQGGSKTADAGVISIVANDPEKTITCESRTWRDLVAGVADEGPHVVLELPGVMLSLHNTPLKKPSPTESKLPSVS